MLVDVALYAGEREILEMRQDILQADITVVVEGDHTFTNKPRKTDTLQNVVHCVVESGLSGDPHENEWEQRRHGLRALEGLDLPDDAVIGFFDVDEIPDSNLIRSCNRVSVWNMPKYQMSLRWFQEHHLTGISGLYSQVKGADVADLRRRREYLPEIRGGHHLSSFMTVDRLVEKWEAFSHTDFVRPNMTEWVAHCWKNGLAIESGMPLRQTDIPDVPERLMSAPDYWFRIAS